jgi:hypothetical protein
MMEAPMSESTHAKAAMKINLICSLCRPPRMMATKHKPFNTNVVNPTSMLAESGIHLYVGVWPTSVWNAPVVVRLSVDVFADMAPRPFVNHYTREECYNWFLTPRLASSPSILSIYVLIVPVQ